ncbi:hypothetical protein HPB50_001894 [Hyalomma asiaticum]|uniref:Uncharacterized protein n=1 Tax=Hyalomma asiaticum TaxID=266040 RepID=A0ACB7SSM9_HYAAI|nr:hypothetical protein HPB50_001894 [Hyalomma asiaticum]
MLYGLSATELLVRRNLAVIKTEGHHNTTVHRDLSVIGVHLIDMRRTAAPTAVPSLWVLRTLAKPDATKDSCGACTAEFLSYSRPHFLSFSFVKSTSPPLFNTAWRNLDDKDPLVSYHEFTSNHKLGPQQSTGNHTQTIAISNIHHTNDTKQIDPDFPTACPYCGRDYNNLEHMLWLCPANAGMNVPDQSVWDSALRSTEFTAQLKAVQRAWPVAEGLMSTGHDLAPLSFSSVSQ